MECPYCEGQTAFEEKLHKAEKLNSREWQVLELWYEMEWQKAQHAYARACISDPLTRAKIEKAHLAFRYELPGRKLRIEIHRCPIEQVETIQVKSHAPLNLRELESLNDLLKQVLRHRTWKETRGPKAELTFAQVARAIRKHPTVHKTQLAPNMETKWTVKQINKAIEKYFGSVMAWDKVKWYALSHPEEDP